MRPPPGYLLVLISTLPSALGSFKRWLDSRLATWERLPLSNVLDRRNAC